MGTKFSTECKLQKIFWDISWWGWWVRKAVCEKAIHFSTFSASRHPAVGWICSLRWSKALLTLCLPSTLIDDKLLFFSSPRHVVYLFCFMKLSKHRCGVVIKASWRCFLYGRCWKTSRALSFLGPLYRTGQTSYLWKDNTLAIPLLHTGLLIFLYLSHDLHHFCWNSHLLIPPNHVPCCGFVYLMLRIVPAQSVPKNCLYTSGLNRTKLEDWWWYRQGKADCAGGERESVWCSGLGRDHSNARIGHPCGKI